MKLKSITARLLILAALLTEAGEVRAAESSTREITLDEAVLLARTRSVDAAVALNELRTSYWSYRTYRADLLPEVTFKATLPSYVKSYSSYQLDNGSYTFVRNNNLRMNGEISVDQTIWATGGTLSLTTSLDYLRQLRGDGSGRFMSIPLALTLRQPIFGVNAVKWNRRIEPVRFREAQARFISATEDVALTAISYFFNLLLARENRNIAVQNLANAEKLYEIAKVKREMGQISQNDLLQLELGMLNARSSLTSCESESKAQMFKLRAFLDIEESVELDPVVPAINPDVIITYEDVLAKAHERNYFAQNLRRRQLEAEYAVARAKGDQRQINLYAQIGYTGTSDRVGGAYDPLKDNQVVELGVQVPLLDWGKRRGKVKVAESNREVVRSRLRKEQQDFDQDIFILVERFNNQREQLAIALQADTIAECRYRTNVETFMIGRISTLDLNDSQVSKDQARQAFIDQLYRYWDYYYQLRGLTLWDYSTGTDIEADVKRIIGS
ncbi:MAG: TolC family protein [Duncaniella sp.]|nr:TolC family protein [Duncaniella sp.]